MNLPKIKEGRKEEVGKKIETLVCGEMTKDPYKFPNCCKVDTRASHYLRP